MSDTTQATIDSSVTPEVSEASEGSSEVSKELSGADDPKESFSDWLKRQEAEKSGKGSKKAPEAKLPTAPDVSGEVKDMLAGDGESAVESEASANPGENDNIRVLKVGDKRFKAEDVAKLDKDYTETKASYEKQVQENQAMIADVEKFVNTLKQSPGEILDRFKITQEQVEQYLWDKYYKFKNESPVDKAARLEQELNDIRTREENSRNEALRQRQQEENTRFWQAKIKEGLDATGLPENEWTIQRMAGYIQQMQQKGLSLSMTDLANYVKTDYQNAQKELLKNMSPDQVAETLGKETLSKVRAHDVEKLKQDKFKNTNPGKGSLGREEAKNKSKKVYKSPYDILDDL